MTTPISNGKYANFSQCLKKKNINRTEIPALKSDKFARVHSSMVSDRCFHTFHCQILMYFFIHCMVFAIVWNRRFCTIQNTMPKEHEKVSKGTEYIISQLSKILLFPQNS
jgi:hypothetical protein